IPNNVNKHVPPARYVVNNHLPSALNTPKSPLIYLRSGGGDSQFFFSLIKTHDKMILIRQIIGKAKNTAYQAIKAIIDPRIGDKTFPIPFDASKIPRTRLCSPPLNKSPVKAIAIGAVPAAPSP